MQDFKNIEELVQKIISAKSNDEIKLSEEAFIKYKKQDSNQFINDMLIIITNDGLNINMRKFAISEIRTSLSDYAKSASPIKLSNINQETINMLQSILFNQASEETNYQLRKQISETIGEVGATLINKSIFNELLTCLLELFKKEKLENLQSAYIILRTLIQYCHQIFYSDINDLNALLEKGLNHQHQSIKVEAIQTLGVVLEYFDRKYCSTFNNLTLSFLNSVYSVLGENKEQIANKDENIEENESVTSVVNTVFDITEKEPSFFQNNFNEFYNAITNMIQEFPKSFIQRLLIESITNYIDRIPESIQGQIDKIENILNLILYQMVQFSDIISQEWINPNQENDDDLENDERSSSIRFGTDLINSFIPNFDDEGDDNIVLELVIKNIKLMFEQGEQRQDWRFPYAAMMLISSIGEFFNDLENLALLLNLSYQHSKDSKNPIIRYAFCHIISQISYDLAPQFQKKQGGDLLPKIIQMLYDTIPRVRAQAAEAILDFVEQMDKETIKPHIDQLCQGLFTLIDNGTIIEKEFAVQALSSIIDASKIYFESHLPTVITKLQNCINQSVNNLDLQQLCYNILECISIASYVTRKCIFQNYLESFVQMLLSYTQKIIENQKDHQNKYIFDAWKRLVYNYSEELLKILDQIMNQTKKLVNMNQNEESLDTDEIQSAIAFMSAYADKFTIYLSDHVSDIYINQISSRNESIREVACKSLPQILRCTKDDNDQRTNLLNEIIKDLRIVIGEEYEPQLIFVQLESMKLCILEGNEFMNEQEFKFFCESIMNVLKESDRRKLDYQKQINDNDIDQQKKNLIPQEYKTEEIIHLEIAHVFGSLYKSHAQQALTFSAYIYTNILQNAFSDPSQILLIQFGMIILQDIVKHIGILRFYEKWDEIINVFFFHLNSQSHLIKKEALHGLSCIVISTPSQYLQTYIPQILEVALDYIKHSGICINLETNEVINNNKFQVFKQNNKTSSIKEYAVDILGKLLKLHGSLLPNDVLITQLWAECLPIKTEKKIADDQHQIYLQYLITQQYNIQGKSKESIQKIFELVSEFYDPNVCTSYMKPILDQLIQEFLENNEIAEAFKQIFNNLSKEQQRRLKKALDSKNAEQPKHNIPAYVFN